MNLLRGYKGLRAIKNSTIATIGNFDGFHLGHQEIVQYVNKLAKTHQMESAVVSFEPTAKEFFLKKEAPARIYNLRDKFEIAKSLHIDHFVCLRFNEQIANMPADEFVKEILISKLRIKRLVVGDDFRFGRNRAGDIQFLRGMAKTFDFSVEDQATVLHKNTRISSSLIREKLAQSDFAQVESLLGRPFTISGRIFHGDKKGCTLGFPTANILLRRKVVPIRGVFVVTANTANKTWNGVANVGYRPTVQGQREQLEVHLFGCEQNLYGQRLSVRFLAKLRDEQKFSSLADLKHQISLDVQQAQNYFLART